MLKLAKVKKVFVLTPGSLRQNFIEEYCKRCGKSPEYLTKYYTFITMNYAVGNKLPSFKDSIVIIDEAHNLINGVKNKSLHQTLIYKHLMDSNCRILALTGTPIYNYIWEWSILGNLLKPNAFLEVIKEDGLDAKPFMDQFNIDEKTGEITAKDEKKFLESISGIISYFPGVSGGFYPKVIYENPIKIPMTPLQDLKYLQKASNEETIRNMGPPPLSMLKKKPLKYYRLQRQYVTALKYISSRSLLNFFYPSFMPNSKVKYPDDIVYNGKLTRYTYKPTGVVSFDETRFYREIYRVAEAKASEKWPDKTHEELKLIVENKVRANMKENIIVKEKDEEIGWISSKNFKNKKLVDIYSRKMVAVVVNVLNNWKAKHVLFSFFKSRSGVKMIHSLFKLCGVKTEIYSGDVSDKKREDLLKRFNAEDNRYGDKIKMLLVTDAGAEGINIFEAQHMHILESSTREMKIQQAIGRVVR